jgi:hypothetical protein
MLELRDCEGTTMKRIHAIGLGVLLIGGGIGGLVYLSSAQKKARESRSWPTVKGRITQCDVVRKGGTTGRGVSNVRYEIELAYSYTVDGKRFRGDRMQVFGVSHKFEDDAQEHARQYPVGKAVPVYYNPDDPEDAVLEPGIVPSASVQGGRWASIGGVVVGVIVLLLALFGGRWTRHP